VTNPVHLKPECLSCLDFDFCIGFSVVKCDDIHSRVARLLGKMAIKIFFIKDYIVQGGPKKSGFLKIFWDSEIYFSKNEPSRGDFMREIDCAHFRE
jgi:hypothetical protein